MLIRSLSKMFRAKLWASITLLQSVELYWSMLAKNLNYKLISPYPSKRHQSFHWFHGKFCVHPIQPIIFEFVGLAAVTRGAWLSFLWGILRQELEESSKLRGKTVMIVLSLARLVVIYSMLLTFASQSCPVTELILNIRPSCVNGKTNRPGACRAYFNV